MLFRMLGLAFLVGLTGSVLFAEEKAQTNTMEGKVVKVTGNKLTMTDKEGKNEHSHILAPDAKITCDGKECKAADLKPGMMIKVTTMKGDKEIAVRVDARTKD